MTTRCLVVDDDPSFAAMLSLHLEEAGLEVATAATCRSALGLARGGPFGLVFLDHQLPDGTGLDLVPRLREHQGEAPLVMVTGQADPGLAAAARRRGVLEVHPKPLSPRRLDDLLERLAGRPAPGCP